MRARGPADGDERVARELPSHVGVHAAKVCLRRQVIQVELGVRGEVGETGKAVEDVVELVLVDEDVAHLAQSWQEATFLPTQAGVGATALKHHEADRRHFFFSFLPWRRGFHERARRATVAAHRPLWFFQ